MYQSRLDAIRNTDGWHVIGEQATRTQVTQLKARYGPEFTFRCVANPEWVTRHPEQHHKRFLLQAAWVPGMVEQ